jgi:hypothetical protein
MRAIVVGSFVVVTGCSAFGTRTAKTLPASKVETAINVNAPIANPADGPDAYPLPVGVDIGIRRGMTDNVELGGRIGGFYNEVDLKVRLLGSEYVHLALSPIAGYGIAMESYGTLTGGMAGFATVDVGDRVSVLTGARGTYIRELDSGEDDDRLGAAFVGVELRGGDYAVRPIVEALTSDLTGLAAVVSVQLAGVH